jgi:hypothetical protein
MSITTVTLGCRRYIHEIQFEDPVEVAARLLVADQGIKG